MTVASLVPLQVANTDSGSATPTIAIAVVLMFVMIGTVGYLAWKNRKAVLQKQKEEEEQS